MRSLTIDDKPPLVEFIDLSWRLNSGDPRWVPPIRAGLNQELAGADAFGTYGRMRLFVCRSDSAVVGRLAAIVNPRLANSDGQPVGQVGYFESVDDDRVAESLFKAACSWLRASGAREVLGPMNGGAHRLHRLMTAGFDRDPFLFEPRNPAYYPRLFESYGFTRRRLWYSCDAPRATYARALQTVATLRVDDRVADRYEIARVSLADPGSVLSRMHAQLDRLWAGHVGYSSLDLPEFAEAFGPALTLMSDGDLLALVDRSTGSDVGYVFGYPDFADDVRVLDGDASRWGAWRNAGTRPRRMIMHTIAVVPEVRRTGAATLLVRGIFERAVNEGYDEGVMALVTQEFRSLKTIAPPTREYALYGRALD